jgi:F-type H+-transporting ATPase subunit gamma
MKRSRLIQTQLYEITTIQNLASALEGVSSIRLAKIRDVVLQGRECFNELWETYSELRVDRRGNKRFIGAVPENNGEKKPVNILITSDNVLGGSIDQKIIDYFIAQPNATTNETVVIGAHGAQLLTDRGITPAKVYPLPDLTASGEIRPVVNFIEGYGKITAFYESYISLGKQEVATIDLVNAVSDLGSDVNPDEQIISTRDYIFEPSLDEIVTKMESTMLEIALAQVILDSRLAQFASRFNAMILAEDKAKQRRKELYTSWRKAWRDESDKQLKESLAGETQ